MLVGRWLCQIGDSARHIRNIVFRPDTWSLWADDEDLEVHAIPSLMKDLRSLFKNTSAMPSLLLEVEWLRAILFRLRNDDVYSTVIAEVEDAAAARKSFREILDGRKASPERMESQFGVSRHGRQWDIWEENLEGLCERANRLVKALASDFDS